MYTLYTRTVHSLSPYKYSYCGLPVGGVVYARHSGRPRIQSSTFNQRTSIVPGYLLIRRHLVWFGDLPNLLLGLRLICHVTSHSAIMYCLRHGCPCLYSVPFYPELSLQLTRPVVSLHSDVPERRPESADKHGVQAHLPDRPHAQECHRLHGTRPLLHPLGMARAHSERVARTVRGENGD